MQYAPKEEVTAAAEYTPPEKVRAAFVYVGPVGDFGWTFQHDIGRRVAEELFGKDWLETTYVESVSEAQLSETIDNLISQGYNVIFTTSFEFMDKTIEAGKKYPDKFFFHCSGYKRYKNVGTYFADLYQIYYLNGLIAGALTKTGKIGYVAAFTIPEVVRHINAFAIGAKEVGEQLGKNITVYVIQIGAWYAPDKARQAAQTLVEQYGVDVIAYTEDSTAIIEWAQNLYETEGKLVYVFSHYSPGYSKGPDVVPSGQLVRWEVIYVDILAKIKAGIYTPYNLENVDYWYLLNTGAVELGAHIYENGSVMMINPKFVPELKNIKVKDKLTGEEVSVYDLVMRRYEEMKNAFMLTPLQLTAVTHKYENIATIKLNYGTEDNPRYIDYPIAAVFDPFTGPLSGYMKDEPSKKVTIPEGQRLGHDDLWEMQWFVDWVVFKGAI
ncbi:BMP family ABC transporter substrate-binding protein [Desulfurococcaceae archaeon MEX13E-LK6-19]|nr:BMP family ABC transporter substrate-binding protein [Desulfurococcaceae archaeon MEX13E-LK6-19]